MIAFERSVPTDPPHEHHPWLILITGAPATGKTTMAVPLATRLGVPYISKDAIKERLFDTLGWQDREWSKRLGDASFALLYDFVLAHLKVGSPLVVEANFKPRIDTPRFLALRDLHPFSMLQLVLYATPAVLQARFAARHAAGERHPGHVDATFAGEFAAQLQTDSYGPLGLPSTIVEVDTTDLEKVDFAATIEDACQWVMAHDAEFAGARARTVANL